MRSITYDEINKDNIDDALIILNNGMKLWNDLKKHPEYRSKSRSKYYELVEDLKIECAFCHVLDCDWCPISLPRSCKWWNSIGEEDPEYETGWALSQDIVFRKFCAGKIADAHEQVIFDLKQKFGISN